MMHNLRGADLILEAVKRDGKNEAKHLTPVGKTLNFELIRINIFCVAS